MKKLIILLFSCFSHLLFAQVSGNANYQHSVKLSNSRLNATFSGNNEILISVKGLSNIEADNYVAVFHITQNGKTIDEVNNLINKRINNVKNELKNKQVKIFIDMLSCVPTYEYEVEKKIFSKKNYTEIPNGFELKKNLHIEYENPDLLDSLLLICGKSDIYDLVKVDYFSSNLPTAKKELMNQAIGLAEEKLLTYQKSLNWKEGSYTKVLADDFNIMYPIEQYASYYAYENNSLIQKKGKSYSNVNDLPKTKTHYYQPITNKEFDIVINPIILGPVIQLMYEIKLKVHRTSNNEKIVKEYFLIAPDGQLKQVKLGE